MENMDIIFTTEEGTVYNVTFEEYYAELIAQNTAHNSDLGA